MREKDRKGIGQILTQTIEQMENHDRLSFHKYKYTNISGKAHYNGKQPTGDHEEIKMYKEKEMIQILE